MQTYLNGKITITSLAAPTVEDMEKIQALSDEERADLVREAIERGRNSPLSDKALDDIWHSALEKARAIKADEKSRPEYAV